ESSFPGERMFKLLPNGFSSTPLKDFQSSKGLGDGILPDDEDTFSLLSPIYHDSFDSDEEDQRSTPAQQTSPGQTDDSRLSISPVRCCCKALDGDLHSAPSPALSAWEMWLVSKAKEERLKQEKKTEKAKNKEKQDREREHKKIIKEEKIQEWIKLKREQVNNHFSKITGYIKRTEKKQRKKREKKRAEEKFKEWLAKTNEKSSASSKTRSCPSSMFI
uniref:Coiled-coil domain containing 34 n=1 Tax=Amphilophus citrinellus TaxID=61819 RepID=A0A3Q0SW40_AMPCI